MMGSPGGFCTGAPAWIVHVHQWLFAIIQEIWTLLHILSRPARHRSAKAVQFPVGLAQVSCNEYICTCLPVHQECIYICQNSKSPVVHAPYTQNCYYITTLTFIIWNCLLISSWSAWYFKLWYRETSGYVSFWQNAFHHKLTWQNVHAVQISFYMWLQIH